MGSRNNQSRKPLTYEDLARKYDTTPNKVHSVVKSAYNKIIKNLIENEEVNIFDAVLALREYFNMSESEAVEKLNDEHRDLLKQYATDEFHIKDKNKLKNVFSELFGE